MANNATWRTLLREKQFLQVQRRASRLGASDLKAIYYSKNELLFKTLSGTDKRTVWTQRVILDDVTPDKVRDLSHNELAALIRHSSLHVYCDCPAWKFWGFQYIAWKRGYGLVKETRRPRVRNPRQQGTSCKHIYNVAQVLPLLANFLAKKYKDNIKDKPSNQRTSNQAATNIQQGFFKKDPALSTRIKQPQQNSTQNQPKPGQSVNESDLEFDE